MQVMSDNGKTEDQVEDFRSKPRWSANKKADAVLRLLRGEPLDELSRELGVEAHRLAAWRAEFLEHGKQGLRAVPIGPIGATRPSDDSSARSARSGS